MGNFDFLLKEKQYEQFAQACVDAERSIGMSTVVTAMTARRAMELAVKWVYQFDGELSVPYRDNLASLLADRTFLHIVDSEIVSMLHYIKKLGNLATHNNKKITRDQAVLTLHNLFLFIQWIDYCYGPHYVEQHFTEESLPVVVDLQLKEPQAKVDALSDQFRQDQVPLKELSEQKSSSVKKKYAEKREQASKVQDFQFKPETFSEADTRKHFIDVDLELAGWTLEKDVLFEVLVEGMPNKAGIGYVDYVLYGKDGRPLAIIEAKKTSRDPKIGKQQAQLYAELVEKKFGHEPIIFYTNGFETWMIEQPYPSRRVYGFYTKDELQRLIDRRTLKKPLENFQIKDSITNRYYQKEAIIHTCEALSENQRETLLVMATGSGKTRTAISIVDVLTRNNWIKNILFLADRTSLVKQAYKNFKELMPNLSICNLMESKDDGPQTNRMIFSTYPTMMNSIDAITSEDDSNLFTIGHFDLIIIDEAHRSIYQKYQAIFDYFDSIIVGLTATPREDIDRNTYNLFNLENGVPTYAYDLDIAVADGYLVPFRTIETKTKLLEEGIHYNELSEEEKAYFDDTFADEPETKDIDSNAINNWLFNQETIDLVVKQLMQKGIRDSTGDDVGKTILFAKNHRHATAIKERFDKLYPEKGAKYAEVIDYRINYYQSLIDNFSDKDKMPQIAISVDMLDTGIDVPEVVNLVFFKKVRSKIKFWQMIGRGTRLSENLFGPGKDKSEFLIFDYGANFEFFEIERNNSEPKIQIPLAARLFNIKVEIIRELQSIQYQTEEKYVEFRKDMLDTLVSDIRSLNTENFRVRMKLKYVLEYKNREAWDNLNVLKTNNIKEHIAPLIYPSGEDEDVRRFDLMMFTIEVAVLTDANANRQIRTVMDTARQLSQKGTIPQVLEKKELLHDIQTVEYWGDITLFKIENIRLSLRSLIQYLTGEEQMIYYTDFEDEIISSAENNNKSHEVNDLRSYKQKVEHYIIENKDNTAVYKLHHNMELTEKDVNLLEEMLWNQLGTKEQYEKDYGNKSVSRLVREIIGVDHKAVLEAFSNFISNNSLKPTQVHFVRMVMEYVERNGYLEKTELTKEPFKSAGNILHLFENNRGQVTQLLKIVYKINKNADSLVNTNQNAK